MRKRIVVDEGEVEELKEEGKEAKKKEKKKQR